VIFAIEFLSLFFARALFVWFYNVTAYSVPLVAIFQLSHAMACHYLIAAPPHQRSKPPARSEL